jgi:hypothetical protein
VPDRAHEIFRASGMGDGAGRMSARRHRGLAAGQAGNLPAAFCRQRQVDLTSGDRARRAGETIRRVRFRNPGDFGLPAGGGRCRTK